MKATSAMQRGARKTAGKVVVVPSSAALVVTMIALTASAVKTARPPRGS